MGALDPSALSMPFTLAAFIRTRPFLFHLTAQGNLNGIMDTRTLFPASTLLSVNGRILPRLSPRRQHMHAERDGRWIWIRDQCPLHEGNIAFEAGWNMARLLAHLDAHVFFWPGKPDGTPIDHGTRHYERYAHEKPALLRILTTAMLDANPTWSRSSARSIPVRPGSTMVVRSPEVREHFYRRSPSRGRRVT